MKSPKRATRCPVIGDVPVLGYLFQNHLNSRVKRNLLVFVTPTIITSKYGTGLEDQVSGLHHVGRGIRRHQRLAQQRQGRCSAGADRQPAGRSGLPETGNAAAPRNGRRCAIQEFSQGSRFLVFSGMWG